jgi:hypothetical protein
VRQTKYAYIVLTGKSQVSNHLRRVYSGGSIIKIDVGLSEMWTELNWLIVVV